MEKKQFYFKPIYLSQNYPKSQNPNRNISTKSGRSTESQQPSACLCSTQEEGDLLQPDELLAAASHRSQEESSRQTKPSENNGGAPG